MKQTLTHSAAEKYATHNAIANNYTGLK